MLLESDPETLTLRKDLQNSLLENLKILESAPFPSKTLIKRLRGFRTPSTA